MYPTCPLDQTELIPIGSIQEYGDNAVNYSCPTCKRVWYRVEDGWASRTATVTIKKLPEVGDRYDEIIQPAFLAVDCPACQGFGVVPDLDADIILTCPRCGGTGLSTKIRTI